MADDRILLTDEQLAAFLDGNLSRQELAHVIASLSFDSEAADIIDLASSIYDEWGPDSTPVLLPMNALAAANPESLCSFQCETFILHRLNFDVDHWSLLEIAKANNWLRGDGTPLHHVGRLLELKGLAVQRKYDTTLAELADATAAGHDVIAIVDRKIIEADKPVDPNAPSYHAIYITDVNDSAVKYLDLETCRKREMSADTFLEAWKCSGNYMVTASATHTEYNPRPINVEDILLDGDLEDLTEAIAENAHDVWARARMDEGWTYGDVRDDTNKRHPDLVPYAKLPEGEKQYDRLMAMQTLRLVRRLGFEIIKRKPLSDL